ncbi:MAG: N-acetylmuramoyl-L-alanine amidase [Acidimicrobiia bacterium]
MRRALTTVVVLVLGIVPGLGAAANADSHLTGVLIALDAGHGGDESGAVGTTTDGAHTILEKDLNRAVVEELKKLLEDAGATVVLSRDGDETIESRRDRVSEVRDECKALGGDCDLLVSVHHNGSSDHSVDYTQVFVTQKKDVALGEVLHDRLVGLTGDGHGVSHDGFGMTVHGGLVSALTEAYFITNHIKADSVWPALCTYYDDWGYSDIDAGCETVPPPSIPMWGENKDLTIIEFEADLLMGGISDYLDTLGTGDDGGGKDCPPGKAKRGEC